MSKRLKHKTLIPWPRGPVAPAGRVYTRLELRTDVASGVERITPAEPTGTADDDSGIADQEVDLSRTLRGLDTLG